MDAYTAAQLASTWSKPTDRAYRRRALETIELAASKGEHAANLVSLAEPPSPCVRLFLEERGFRVGEPANSICWARVTWPRLSDRGAAPDG